MKRIAILVLLLLCASSCFAQLVLPSGIGVVQAPIDANGWISYKLVLTQNVTSFSFVVIPNGTPPPSQAVRTVEFVQNNIGGFSVVFASSISNPCTITTTANAITVCQFSFDATNNTWIGFGGGGGGAQQNVITATFNANEVQVMDITTTINLPTISSAGQAKWTQGDVGKTIVGFDFCEQQASPSTATQIIGTTSANPTILSVQDATHITLSVNASASKTNACIDYGTPDDTAASAINTTLTTTTLCPKIQLPAGRIMLTSGYWNAAVTACTNTPQNKSGSPAIFPALVIAGQGAGSTILHLLPAFNFASCTGGSTALSCFGGQKFTQIRDLTITGDGISYSSGAPAAGAVGIELNCGSLLNVSTLFWGYSSPRATPIRGVESTCSSSISTDTISNYVEDGFGSQGFFGNGNYVASNMALADNCDIPLWHNSGNGVIQGGLNLIGQNTCGAANNAVIEFQAGILTAALSSFYSSSTSSHGIQMDGAGTITLLGTGSFGGFSSLAATQTDIVLNNASAILNLQNTKWAVGSSTLCGGSGGTVNDLGGNNYGGLTCTGFTTYTFKHYEQGNCVFAASTTCVVTFSQPFGTSAVPGTVTITGYNPGAVTFTISTPTATGFTITGSASNSLTVAWTAKL